MKQDLGGGGNQQCNCAYCSNGAKIFQMYGKSKISDGEWKAAFNLPLNHFYFQDTKPTLLSRHTKPSLLSRLGHDISSQTGVGTYDTTDLWHIVTSDDVGTLGPFCITNDA